MGKRANLNAKAGRKAVFGGLGGRVVVLACGLWLKYPSHFLVGGDLFSVGWPMRLLRPQLIFCYLKNILESHPQLSDP